MPWWTIAKWAGGLGLVALGVFFFVAEDDIWHLKNDPQGMMTKARQSILNMALNGNVDESNWRSFMAVANAFDNAGCQNAAKQIRDYVYSTGLVERAATA